MVNPSSNLFRRGRNGKSLVGSFKQSSSSLYKRKARGNYKYKLREDAGALISRDYLTSAFLNIDGFSDAKHVDVTNFVSKVSPDIFFILETKRREEEVGSDIDIHGYDQTEVKRSDAAGDKQGGGIVYYTKKTRGVLFKRHSPVISHQDLEYVQNERVWVTVQSQSCETAFCSVYLGCQYSDDRNKSWNEGIYWVLRSEAVALRAAGYRLQFLGDFNGHVGAHPGQGVPGNSPDINPNGERFLEFLLSCDLRHINGEFRNINDPESRICEGLWTRQRGNSRSIIDFIGVSAEHVNTVVSMNVDDSGSYGGGSDHNWSWIKMNDKFRVLVPAAKRQQKKKKSWNIADDQDWNIFKEKVAEQFLPAVDGADTLELDDLASLVANGFRKGGESSIGYRKNVGKSSMKSRSLPRDVVSELELKSQMEKNWKTLFSSMEASVDDVTEAENTFRQ